jgi:RimJ/RimL family protein N-acetyltransferase
MNSLEKIAMKLPILRTARLELNGLSRQDIGELRELDSDPVVREFIDGGRPIKWEDYEQRTTAWLERLQTLGAQLGFWSARIIASSEFIGWFHLRPNSRFDHRIELGYRLKRSFWGKGFATEGSRALISYGFDQLGLDSIMAQTLQRNLASRRVMEKLGMQVEAEFTYPADVLPFWTADERLAIRYSISRESHP